MRLENGYHREIFNLTPVHQHIYDLAELCAAHGISKAVICPGSRSAPLVLGFANHKRIKSYVIPDERSAGFIALGMAQSDGNTVVLISTSGSAAYNFAPAVAEAYYQQVPLLVLTADRPPEWIGQRDGQTIVQDKIFGEHVKASFTVHSDFKKDQEWIVNRYTNESILLANRCPQGPVHLNFPLAEPLYPTPNQKILFRKPRTIQETASRQRLDESELKTLINELGKSKKILCLGGQYPSNQSLLKGLKGFIKSTGAVVAGDILSNLHSMFSTIRFGELFLEGLADKKKEQFKPDLLITWGQGIISKQTKLFLRKHPAKHHWHLQPAGDVADTYKGLTKIIRTTPEDFFYQLTKSKLNKKTSLKSAYSDQWIAAEKIALGLINDELQKATGEASMVKETLRSLKGKYKLHLANSMSVRYASLCGLMPGQTEISVFSNRGTSGIDGCTSTAVGHAWSDNETNLLITGDVAFFYDRNAFWNSSRLKNLRILLLNNHGGRIFSMIDGPKDRKEVNEFFVGPQNLNAKHLCEEFGFEHHTVHTIKDAHQALNKFLKPGGKTKILEFIGNPMEDRMIFENLKKTAANQYGKEF